VKLSPLLLERLEVLRRLVGVPLIIRSGYRCPEHNAAIGGARQSQHLYGRAADLDAGIATFGQARSAGFTGIGTFGRWATHVDVRPGPLTTWRY
jgi:zinc D-Ala-D-Ala carboxypeptidase